MDGKCHYCGSTLPIGWHKSHDAEIATIQELFTEHYPGKIKITLKKFIEQLPIDPLIKAMTISCEKFENEDSKTKADDTIKYFCGICWNWIKDPTTRDW